MTVTRCDFETRSDVDLKTRGQGVYFESPHFMPLILCYQIDHGTGPTLIWEWTYRDRYCPLDLRRHIEDGCPIRAHNASFERQCFDWLADNWGWPRPKIEQYVDTAAEAAAMSLPRSLEDVGQALGLTVQKDKIGKALIQKFSIPRRPKKDEPEGVYFNEPEDFPVEFRQFVDYCAQDVRAETAVANRIVPLSAYEQDLYTIDQRINARGMRIDTVSARAAIRLADKAKLALDRAMREATDGAVTACSQVARLTEWVEAQGVHMASAAKADILDMLELEDLPQRVRKALMLRQEAAKTSVSKLTAFLKRVSRDGRLRNAFLFCAAGTGRWSSVGAQVHNLPRPRKEFGDAKLDLDILFAAIRTESPEYLVALYGLALGRALWLLSDAIRGFIWAAVNHDLLVADYSGIEGAVAAWLSGEEWKLKAFREINTDPVNMPDMYRRTAAGIFNTTTDIITKKDGRRQVGKVSELALGFGGGVGAFHSMARNYNLKLEDMFEPVWAAADEERRDRALRRYASCLTRNEPMTKTLSREAWLASEMIKIGWRKTHPAIVAAWAALEAATREAVQNPGKVVPVLKVKYLVANGFLWCLLPSGSALAYGSPKLKDQVWACLLQPDGSWGEAEVVDRERAEWLEINLKAKIQGPTSSKVTVLGVDAVTRKYTRYGLYGGLDFENLVQKIARDLLANGIKLAEANGYPVIGHVHDEIITEVPHGFGDVEEFEKLICQLPDWADGLPLVADGWRGKRYRK